MEKIRQSTLQEYFASPEATLRPVMTSLNGDNSWLLSFPRPPAEQAALGRAFYHVVFEPWLAGPTSLVASWFIHISLPVQPNIATPQEIEDAIHQIESAAAALVPIGQRDQSQVSPPEGEYNGGIDAILLQFHYLDHIHEPTLRLFNKHIPIIAVPEAIDIVKPWGHFKTICAMQDFDPSLESWRHGSLHPGDPAPTWLTPIRLPGHTELNFCTAIVWSHAVESGEDVHEVMFNSPHGTKLDVGPLQAFLSAEPKTEKLAMLHGLKESSTAGSMNTYGAKGGLALYRKVGSTRYWVKSHNAPLAYAGIFMRLFVRDTGRTIDWALEEERKATGQQAVNPDRPNVAEVENGGCIVLK